MHSHFENLSGPILQAQAFYFRNIAALAKRGAFDQRRQGAQAARRDERDRGPRRPSGTNEAQKQRERSGNAAGTQREATRSNGKLREAIYTPISNHFEQMC